MSRNNARRQTGATLILVAFSLAGLLGLAACAVDLGMMYWARQRAQNVADAAALAGGQSLPLTSQAGTAASQVAAANNAGGGDFMVTGITYPALVTLDDGAQVNVGASNAVTVQGYVDAPLSFAPVVGYQPTSQGGAANTVSVPAQATVIIQNACSLPPGAGVAPFGLIGDDPNNADPTARYVTTLLTNAANPQTPEPKMYQTVMTASGQPISLRLNVWDNTGKLVNPGNFDPIQISGNGASYLNTIRQTTDRTLTVGQTLSTLTGNNITLTQQGVGARLAPSNTQFTHNSASYNAWFSGSQETTEGHLIIAPVISQNVKNGTGTVTILAFASFYMEQINISNHSSNLIAQGRFVGLIIPAASGGGCTGAGVMSSPRLVQ